ncbi:MAG: hypothetical protein M1826_000633 [Phylliscum demangeonii]|nr:MAG: hypothetical protein M1826_000633 [Phylliscum demangeonii]
MASGNEPDHWELTEPHYKIIIARSDGKNWFPEPTGTGYRWVQNSPSAEQLTPTLNKEETHYEYYRQVPRFDEKEWDWLSKLGAMCVRYIAGPEKQGQMMVLDDFPQGYRLYEKIKEPVSSGAKAASAASTAAVGDDEELPEEMDLQDTYLYGHPFGPTHRYRSAVDFYEHVHWLCCADPLDHDDCRCVICSPDPLAEEEVEGEGESDDDDSDGSKQRASGESSTEPDDGSKAARPAKGKGKQRAAEEGASSHVQFGSSTYQLTPLPPANSSATKVDGLPAGGDEHAAGPSQAKKTTGPKAGPGSKETKPMTKAALAAMVQARAQGGGGVASSNSGSSIIQPKSGGGALGTSRKAKKKGKAVPESKLVLPMRPWPLPPLRFPDQILDAAYRKYLFRQGEIVWCQRGSWSIAVIVSRRYAQAKDAGPGVGPEPFYIVQPLSHPFHHARQTVYSEGFLRPWLAMTAPPAFHASLRAPDLSYDSIDWAAVVEGRLGPGDALLDGSIFAARAVDHSYALFHAIDGPNPDLPSPAGVRYWGGMYLGPEKIWCSEPVRVKLEGRNYLLLVHDIVEHPPSDHPNPSPPAPPPGPIGSSSSPSPSACTITIIGDVYTLAETGLTMPQIRRADANYFLPVRMINDLEFHNKTYLNSVGYPAPPPGAASDGPRYHWKLVQAQRSIGLEAVLGRWYESGLVIPLLVAPDLLRQQLALPSDIVGDIEPLMNGRQKIGQRMYTREAALAASVPPGTHISWGDDMNTPESRHRVNPPQVPAHMRVPEHPSMPLPLPLSAPSPDATSPLASASLSAAADPSDFLPSAAAPLDVDMDMNLHLDLDMVADDDDDDDDDADADLGMVAYGEHVDLSLGHSSSPLVPPPPPPPPPPQQPLRSTTSSSSRPAGVVPGSVLNPILLGEDDADDDDGAAAGELGAALNLDLDPSTSFMNLDAGADEYDQHNLQW